MVTRTAPRLSARDRRTLTIGATIIAILLIGGRGIPAWLKWVRREEGTAALQHQRLHIAQLRAKSNPTADALVRATGNRALHIAPAFLRGDTPAQTSAFLASYISETAAAVNIRLGAVTVQTDTTSDSTVAGVPVYRVTLHADGTGDVRGIAGWIETLEGSTAPLLMVRTLSVDQSDPTTPVNRPETLRLTIDVDGLGRRDVDQ